MSCSVCQVEVEVGEVGWSFVNMEVSPEVVVVINVRNIWWSTSSDVLCRPEYTLSSCVDN